MKRFHSPHMLRRRAPGMAAPTPGEPVTSFQEHPVPFPLLSPGWTHEKILAPAGRSRRPGTLVPWGTPLPPVFRSASDLAPFSKRSGTQKHGCWVPSRGEGLRWESGRKRPPLIGNVPRAVPWKGRGGRSTLRFWGYLEPGGQWRGMGERDIT